MNCFLFTDLMPEIAGEAAEWRRNVPLGSDRPGPHPSIHRELCDTSPGRASVHVCRVEASPSSEWV